MLDNAKMALLERTIVAGLIKKPKIIEGIKEGLIKKIAKYVKKKDELPSFEWCMSEYNSSKTFQAILAKADISREDVEEAVNELLGENIDTYDIEDSTVTVDKVGRNELCPCGSGKKYKKCCL